jgi:hypothetical protein
LKKKRHLILYWHNFFGLYLHLLHSFLSLNSTCVDKLNPNDDKIVIFL